MKRQQKIVLLQLQIVLLLGHIVLILMQLMELVGIILPILLVREMVYGHEPLYYQVIVITGTLK